MESCALAVSDERPFDSGPGRDVFHDVPYVMESDSARYGQVNGFYF